MNKISLIIPVLNEADNVARFAPLLQAVARRGHEVLLIDGGSDDGSVQQWASYDLQVIVSPKKGRAAQMNLGAERARHDLLWFMHADTEFDMACAQCLEFLLVTPRTWGRFRLRLAGRSLWFRLIENFMEWRSRLSSILTGDQTLVVYRQLFNIVGGFPEQALMEDIEISKRLKRFSKPIVLAPAIKTSTRRWEQKGIVRTMVRMWCLRLAYFLRVSPERLSKWY